MDQSRGRGKAKVPALTTDSCPYNPKHGKWSPMRLVTGDETGELSQCNPISLLLQATIAPEKVS